MNLSEKKQNNIFIILICLIASTIIFREFSTGLIILFALFNVFFFKKTHFKKRDIVFILIIASPFLLDILFFWNNDSFFLGLKSAEKRFSLILFPIILVGHYKKINLKMLLKCYVLITTILLTILFCRYIILNTNDFLKYANGIDLWEIGYHFANSFGTHAPALNMHVSFAALAALYMLLKDSKHYYFLLYLILFFFVLYINTRIAIVNCIVCSLLILVLEFFKKKKQLKEIFKGILVLGVALFICLSLFTLAFPRVIEKFTTDSFSNMDKIGRIDELEKPETKHGSLVMRLSIWKASLELAKENLWIGYGASDSKRELVNYFEKTNQKHLAKWKFPVHNQYIDFLLKFGIFGSIVVIVFVLFIGYLGLKLESSIIICFFIIFFVSNLTDDFLIRYDGIIFSGFWASIFANQLKFKLIEKNKNSTCSSFNRWC